MMLTMIVVVKTVPNHSKGHGGIMPACHHFNLNGLFHGGSHISLADSVDWLSRNDFRHTLEGILMNVRAPG